MEDFFFVSFNSIYNVELIAFPLESTDENRKIVVISLF